MAGLPQIAYQDGIRKHTEVSFRGYDHRLGAGDGTLWDMKNLTGDHYPVLGTRRPRVRIGRLEKPNGLYCHDGVHWVDGEWFYYDGIRAFQVADGRKTFCSLGAYIVILPDKKYFNVQTGAFGELESALIGAAVTIQDGTYAGEPAEANTLYAPGVDFSQYFRVGDAVTISGAAAHPENNQTIIIREIDGEYLRFYENSFITGAGGDRETLGIKRTMPDMDFICENENRLWGCRGDTIYASKLGDPFNWNVFDGLSTDSYAANVGSAGDFTACASFLGYPVFFKEEHIYKVYGDRPSNFQVMGSASLGVEAGSDRSCAIAGETMFYLSRVGVVAYSGGVPQSIAQAFGSVRYKNAVGGSDGRKYYVSMEDAAGARSLFVYDTETGLWHREDDTRALDFGWWEELYYLAADGAIWITGNIREPPEDAEEELPFASVAEFGDFTEAQPNKKGTAKLQLRIELEAQAQVRIDMQFDSDGVWRRVAGLQSRVKRSYYLPIIPRRSDHFRIRITGLGQWRLYSLTREHYTGSEL